ncbi:MAG: type II toxin-antitoxin system HicB family antitoxin [Lachnospiraceae bacterium]|nr:type II toxin-antitoxin system HicB family antitoxin [Lachnospiraceae bacterium]
MTHYFYPAIFHKEENGGFWISFPDFPECFTQGDSIENAYEMSVEAMGLCIDEKLKNNEPLPNSSAPADIILNEGDFSILVEFDLTKYRRTHNLKSVKKTLSIPEWLNEAAMAQKINFSKVLQEALLQKVENV